MENTQLAFIKAPSTEMSDVEKWAYFNAAEKEAKAAKDAVAKQALSTVGQTEHKFIKTQLGGAQMINKSTVKAKDSLKFFLQKHNLLEQCKKDEIDLKKVEVYVEAGVISKEEFEQHISVATSSYLQLKK
ncbi:hypothetical protein [Microcystis phage MaeS]|nr:hypothetical protein [Microcystis phage MaeS]